MIGDLPLTRSDLAHDSGHLDIDAYGSCRGKASIVRGRANVDHIFFQGRRVATNRSKPPVIFQSGTVGAGLKDGTFSAYKLTTKVDCYARFQIAVNSG